MRRNFGLDLARVLAVTLVLAYHTFGAQANLLGAIGGAGWVGVDIFFVLSGFLVTLGFQRIQEAGEAHQFDWGASARDFYQKRARRIIPTYLVVVVAVTAITAALPPLRARALSNVPFYLTFTANQVEILALVLWSISLEAQFYLVLPLMGLGRPGERVADVVRRSPWASLSLALSLPALVRAVVYLLHPELHASVPQVFTPNIPVHEISTSFGKWVYTSSFAHLDGLLLGAWLGMVWHGRVRAFHMLVERWKLPILLFGLVGLVSTCSALAPWRTWMPRPWAIGVFGFSVVGLSSLALVLGLKTVLAEPPRQGWLRRAVQWGSDRIYSIYLGQAVASVCMSLVIIWPGLDVRRGLILTAVYVILALSVGILLYRLVESRFFRVGGEAPAAPKTPQERAVVGCSCRGEVLSPQ